jgi:hypothetical protein
VKSAFLKKITALDKQSPNLRKDALDRIEEAGLLYLFAP